ncbi:putative tail protein 1 [Pectobacterium phage DU_PP_V]|uniref:Putative tail protein 1 n=1 Tax=Pectobacterium phage DU_PP_V TaxID=2041492 RepID=A0A2D2W714_9CAUD|nr:collar tail protein for L-shaped tail fibre attachment [Pectobacterium phage DU_PP_V]ATS94091.1 putative tail protein 1 [Pectobacterium phage DU_PP_V]
MTENKNLDLVIDENIDYSLLLQFSEDDGPTDLTGLAISGSIATSLGANPIVNFTSTIRDAEAGLATISLTKAEVAVLVSNASTTPVDKFDTRKRFVGYYDILVSRTSMTTRIIQGRIFVSLGVTDGN